MSVFANASESIVKRIRSIVGDGTSLLLSFGATSSVLRLVSNLIVSRILSPDDYGVMAIIASISYVLEMISDMAMRGYIPRHPTAEAEMLQTLWTVRAIRNVALFLLMFFGAETLAGLYNAPEVVTTIQVMSATFLIGAVPRLSNFTAERERRVARLSVIEFAQFLFVTLVTIIAAYFLRSYWAFVLSALLNATLSAANTYLFLPGHKIRFLINKTHFKDYWLYLRFALPSSLLTIVLTQTDKFVMANYFSLAELGKFAMAATLIAAAAGLSQQYVMRVFLPLFAEANRESRERAASVFYASRRRLVCVFALGFGGLIGGGELLVKILFNENFAGTGLYLAILSLAPLAKLSQSPGRVALVSCGFYRFNLTTTIYRFVWVVIVGYIAFHYFGAIGVIVAISAAEFALLPYLYFFLHRFGLLQLREEALIYATAAVGIAIGYACQFVAFKLIENGILPNF